MLENLASQLSRCGKLLNELIFVTCAFTQSELHKEQNGALLGVNGSISEKRLFYTCPKKIDCYLGGVRRSIKIAANEHGCPS